MPCVLENFEFSFHRRCALLPVGSGDPAHIESHLSSGMHVGLTWGLLIDTSFDCIQTFGKFKYEWVVSDGQIFLRWQHFTPSFSLNKINLHPFTFPSELSFCCLFYHWIAPIAFPVIHSCLSPISPFLHHCAPFSHFWINHNLNVGLLIFPYSVFQILYIKPSN